MVHLAYGRSHPSLDLFSDLLFLKTLTLTILGHNFSKTEALNHQSIGPGQHLRYRRTLTAVLQNSQERSRGKEEMVSWAELLSGQASPTSTLRPLPSESDGEVSPDGMKRRTVKQKVSLEDLTASFNNFKLKKASNQLLTHRNLQYRSYSARLKQKGRKEKIPNCDRVSEEDVQNTRMMIVSLAHRLELSLSDHSKQKRIDFMMDCKNLLTLMKDALHSHGSHSFLKLRSQFMVGDLFGLYL